MTDTRELLVVSLGLIDYDQAHVFQRATARLRIRGEIAQDVLILCEHPPVVTTGRSTKAGNLLADAATLAKHDIMLRDVERGGDVTVHEPGQLVGYPIIDLKRHQQDLHWYLRQVEEALIQALGRFQLQTGRHVGQTGVWIGERKLASIGVHARDWVTSHGFALNAHNDLRTFNWIVPCGIAGVTMTSVQQECLSAGVASPTPDELHATVVDAFTTVFALSARTATHEMLSAIRAEIGDAVIA
ncbi:MAG: lipoyl(octanoyl) transferase LipB [Gemmatimonadaceae bacterium]